jgi:protein SCO1
LRAPVCVNTFTTGFDMSDATIATTGAEPRPPAAARGCKSWRAWLIALSTLAMVHCAKHEFNSVDISGASYARDFSLLDTSGQRRTMSDYHGKTVILFFGYTQCPDVCPATLSQLARVRRDLGPDGAKVQVLFVTLDPARDTPELIARYVPGFDPSFVGLYGSEAEIAATAREFRIFYQKVDGSSPTTYTLDHTAGSFVFDSTGQVRLFIRGQASADQIEADLKRLLS